MKCKPLMAAFATLQLASCASVIPARDGNFALSSNPPYARALYEGQVYFTPTIMSLPRDTVSSISVEKEGYQSQTLSPKMENSPASARNQSAYVLLVSDPAVQNGERPSVLDAEWSAEDKSRWDSHALNLFRVNDELETADAISSFGLWLGTGLSLIAVIQPGRAGLTCSIPFSRSESCDEAYGKANRIMRLTLPMGFLAMVTGLIFQTEADHLADEKIRLLVSLNEMNLHYGPPFIRSGPPPDATPPEDSTPLQLEIEYGF